MVRGDCTDDIEPALESLCESTAYPALTENEAVSYTHLLPDYMGPLKRSHCKHEASGNKCK